MFGFRNKAKTEPKTGPQFFNARRVSYRDLRSSKAHALNYLTRLGQAMWGSRDYQQYVEVAYQVNVIAQRCIKLKAESLATLPWYVEANNEPVSNHPALQLLMNPNPSETGLNLLEKIAAFLDIAGDAYLEAVIIDGRAGELYALRPDRMKMKPNDEGLPGEWIYSVGGIEERFPIFYGTNIQQPICHFTHFNPDDDVFGQSLLEPAMRAVECFNDATTYQKALLENDCRPSGVLKMRSDEKGDGLNDEQFERLKTQINEEHSGPQNNKRPLVLEGGLEWQPTSMNMEELDFINSKREMAREIAIGLGLPPALLGLPGDNSYANYAEANRAFYRQTILPAADKIAARISKFLLPSFGPFRLRYDIDEISGLESEREARWKRVAIASWLTDDEKRAATGYGPKPPGAILSGEKQPTPGLQGDRGADEGDRAPRDLGQTLPPLASPAAQGADRNA